MKHNYKLFLLTWFCCCAGGAFLPIADAASDAVMARRFAVVKSWNVWPKDTASTLTLADNDNTVLQLHGADSATMYQWVEMEPNTLYRVSFSYKMDFANSQPDAKIELRFRQTNGSSKQLKSYRYPLNDDKSLTWQQYSFTIVTPDETHQTTQFMFSRGAGEGTLYLKDIRLERETAISIPRVADVETPMTSKVLLWNGAPFLDSFWNAEAKGEAARFDTKVQLAYGEKALYVLFTNHEPHIASLNKSQTERDGRIWNDDSNEIYIATDNGNAYQFITGAGGGMWDGKLIQRVDGDPYKADSSWNGAWQSTVHIGEDRWWTAWRIPFSSLGETPKTDVSWRINFVRHRYAGGLRESTRWTYADGASNAVDRYGYLHFNAENADVKRFVEAIELHPLRIERPDAAYQAVLADQPGNYHTGDWGHDFYLGRYPAAFQEKYTEESWREVALSKLRERGENGSDGTFLPGIYNLLGWAALEEAHEKYGMKFPYSMTTSGNDAIALENGARYYNEQPHGVAKARVVEFDPAKRESILATLDKFLQRHPGKTHLIANFTVVDEPTNSMFGAFSRTRRTDAEAILDDVDAQIRTSFGGGRFGLYDSFGARNANSPYERIAFVRWWNAQMGDWARQVYQGLKQRAPEIPVEIANHNTVSGIPFIDVPLLSHYSDYVSVDPYPTATLALYGRARALYHTGFATKWMHDLAGNKEMATIAQGFVYHGTEPSAEDVREWASQALKNGAQTLNWYASGPASIAIPDAWREINEINQQVGEMNKIAIPTATKTAIFHSYISQAGLDDNVLHSAYTVYSLLGERMGAWFEFVGDTDGKPQDLSKYDLIYVPSASYLTPETAQTLVQRAKDGATIVFFDPLSLSRSALGEPLSAIRSELIGGSLGEPRKAAQLLVKGGVIAELPESTQLPLTPMAEGIYHGSVLAYDMEPPKDAQVFAHYENGKPAAYSRNVGEGRVLYFAAHPFGNSDLAIKDSEWEGLLRALAANIDEPTDLPIWNFYLKE